MIYTPFNDWYYVTYQDEKTHRDVNAWMPAGRLKIVGTDGFSN